MAMKKEDKNGPNSGGRGVSYGDGVLTHALSIALFSRVILVKENDCGLRPHFGAERRDGALLAF